MFASNKVSPTHAQQTKSKFGVDTSPTLLDVTY